MNREILGNEILDVCRNIFLATAEYRDHLQKLDSLLENDFNVTHESGVKLRKILDRDFTHGSENILSPGSEDYIVKAVVEVLFGNELF